MAEESFRVVYARLKARRDKIRGGKKTPRFKPEPISLAIGKKRGKK